ncbi:iron ABC transporter permease [Lipingzhangella sp. LS1_29]|uniref:Iron ABC transporter permease n=1 Tax=Lipingzhangella rawalii TaxID=2055835 RepID=A0ABU2H6N7_9ACTN|nr:iron ABC transporter permease [Lipingzhangella rawalii]MDS1270662.1 iron ABC transporter permease [Lipingzhangella rawalii]
MSAPDRVQALVHGQPLHRWLLLVVPALVLSLGAGVALGPVTIPPGQVLHLIVGQYLPGLGDPPSGPRAAIINEIRLPRVVLGAVVGAGLAITGAVLQAILRNPLADPYLIGATGGASLGAVLVIIAGITPFGLLSLPLSAFLGAMVAFLVVIMIANRSGQLAPTRLILAGVAIAALTEALTSYIVLSSQDNEVRSAMFWMLGGFTSAQWRTLSVTAVVVAVALVFFLAHSTRLNALALGDEGATSLGVEVDRIRMRLMVACALVVGSCVAVSGGIGFVALMVPHAVRMVAGGDNRRVLPLSACVGALLMLWVDVGARMVNQPEEIPVGIITAVLGAPFFIYLLLRSQRGVGQ